MITITPRRLQMRDLARNIYQCTPLKMMFVFISLCFMLMAVCAFRPASAPTVITGADNGKTVVVPSGEQVIIQLPDNAGSTGYTWNFTTSRNQVLTLQNSAYIPPSHPMPGAPGTIAFTFLAHDSGSVNMYFELRRSWEKNVPPAQRFTVTIQVQSHGTGPSHR